MSDSNQTLVIPDSKNLFVFPSNMGHDTMDAAMDCHSFAVQAANAQYHPMTQTQQWFEFYIEIMQKCGWVPFSYGLTQETSSAHHLEMGSLLSKGLATAVSALSGGAALPATGHAFLTEIKDAVMSSEGALKLFEREAEETDKGILRLGKCDQAENGQVVLLVSAVHTDAEPDSTTNILSLKWRASGSTTYVASAAMGLHRGLYEVNKAVIRERIGAVARETLLSVRLKKR